MTTTLTVYCAWCGKYLGSKDGQGVAGVSHGICPECLMAEQKEVWRKDRNAGLENGG